MVKTTCSELCAALKRVKTAARDAHGGTSTFIFSDGKVEVQSSGLTSIAKTWFDADCSDNQTVRVDGAKVLAILETANSDSALQVDLTKANLIFRFEGANLKIPLLSEETFLFDTAVWGKAVPAFSLSGKELKKILSKVAFAAARKDIRYYLNAILFQADSKVMSVVATNGHMLAETKSNQPMAVPEMLMPIEVAGMLSKVVSDDEKVEFFALTAKDTVEGKLRYNGFGIKTGSFELTSALVEGKFPDWKRIVSQPGQTSIQVSKSDLENAVERIDLFGSGDDSVSFELSGNKLVISDFSGEGTDQIEATSAGTAWNSKFNPSYVLSALSTVSDVVELLVDCEDGGKPLAIKSQGDDETTIIIMPMRI